MALHRRVQALPRGTEQHALRGKCVPSGPAEGNRGVASAGGEEGSRSPASGRVALEPRIVANFKGCFKTPPIRHRASAPGNPPSYAHGDPSGLWPSFTDRPTPSAQRGAHQTSHSPLWPCTERTHLIQQGSTGLNGGLCHSLAPVCGDAPPPGEKGLAERITVANLIRCKRPPV